MPFCTSAPSKGVPLRIDWPTMRCCQPAMVPSAIRSRAWLTVISTIRLPSLSSTPGTSVSISRREAPAAEAMAAGDASFHSGWTLHHAPGNATDRMRAVMTIIYFADGTRIAPTREGSEPDRHKWLGSLAVKRLKSCFLMRLVR